MSKQNPFKIEIAKNEQMNCHDLLLHVGGLKDDKEAKQFADVLVEWLTHESGWAEKFQ